MCKHNKASIKENKIKEKKRIGLNSNKLLDENNLRYLVVTENIHSVSKIYVEDHRSNYKDKDIFYSVRLITQTSRFIVGKV